MLQMCAVQLKPLLNAACKVVDNICTFPLGDHLNLLNDGCLQCNNGERINRLDVVFEQAPKENLPSVSCLNNLETTLEICLHTKDFLHRLRHYFAIFG